MGGEAEKVTEKNGAKKIDEKMKLTTTTHGLP